MGNIASRNMNTMTQLESLKNNLANFKSKNIQVILVPSNSFNNEPNNFEKIKELYTEKLGLSYPILSTMECNGEYLHPVYKFLKKRSDKFNQKLCQGIQLNGDFTKFLVPNDGQKVKCFEPNDSIENIIESLS